MYEKILVAADTSFASKRALKEGLFLASLNHGVVYVIHVIPSSVEGVMEEPTATDRSKIEGEELLDSCVRNGEKMGVTVEKIPLISGVPEDVIKSVAIQKGADIIIMGAHGRKGYERLSLGSVVENVIRNSNIPIMCLRGENDGITKHQERDANSTLKVLVPFDGTLKSRNTLTHFVIPFAKSFNQSQVYLRYHLDTNSDILESTTSKKKTEAENFLNDAKTEISHVIGPERVFADLVVEDQHAADGITNYATDFDLIIMSTNGRGGLARVFLGSITEQVLRQCNTPVLVISPKCMEAAQVQTKS